MAIERAPNATVGNPSNLKRYRPASDQVARYHVVKPGMKETLETVASANGISVKELLAFNFPGTVIHNQIVPPVVNWYLHHHAEFNCPETQDGKNRIFRGNEKLAIPSRTTVIDFEDPMVIEGSVPVTALDSIDIYCVSKGEHFDFVLFMSNVVHPMALSVSNVANLANRVVLACKGSKLGELTIVGHGNPFGQYIGSDWVDKDSLKTFRSDLARLIPLFGRDGLVTMGGCEQGQNGSFLLALSDLLNVPVRGFTAFQRPLFPGNQGSETRCFLTCTRGEKDVWDDYIDPAIKSAAGM